MASSLLLRCVREGCITSVPNPGHNCSNKGSTFRAHPPRLRQRLLSLQAKENKLQSRQASERIFATESITRPTPQAAVDSTINLSVEPLPLAEALQALRKAVDGWARSCGNANTRPNGLLRFEAAVRAQGEDAVTALRWLQTQQHAELPCCYFSARARASSSNPAFPGGDDGGNASAPTATAGIGAAAVFQGEAAFSEKDWQQIRRFTQRGSKLTRAYGCLRFDSERASAPEWEAFGGFFFMLPQVEMLEFRGHGPRRDELVLAANLAWDEQEPQFSSSAAAAAESLQRTFSCLTARVRTSPTSPSAQVVSRIHVPDQNAWDATVRAVVAATQNHSAGNHLSKVVLARSTRLKLDRDLSCLELLESLQERDETAYQFCIRLPGGPAFLGNTPEQLFYRKDRMMSSEAVAATRYRGRTVEEDRQIALDLMCSDKDHMEFNIVRQDIKKYLETICTKVLLNPGKDIHRQVKVQHLYARIFGELEDEVGEFKLLSSLHPTPAVGGNPQNKAKAFILNNEKFDRGMYAGPVGWFGATEAEFAVGIRSALMPNAREIIVYAGAGIVNGSNPYAEWQELELKSSQFVDVFHNYDGANSLGKCR